jgi:hypothetical protein
MTDQEPKREVLYKQARDIVFRVGFEVLTAVSTKMAVF